MVTLSEKWVSEESASHEVNDDSQQPDPAPSPQDQTNQQWEGNKAMKKAGSVGKEVKFEVCSGSITHSFVQSGWSRSTVLCCKNGVRRNSAKGAFIWDIHQIHYRSISFPHMRIFMNIGFRPPSLHYLRTSSMWKLPLPSRANWSARALPLRHCMMKAHTAEKEPAFALRMELDNGGPANSARTQGSLPILILLL